MLAKEKFAVTFNGQSCRRNFQRAKRAYFERELDTDMEMDMDMAEDVAPSPLFLFAISACVCVCVWPPNPKAGQEWSEARGQLDLWD